MVTSDGEAQDRRLRHREGADRRGRAEPDRHRHDGRHADLHGAGAGDGGRHRTVTDLYSVGVTAVRDASSTRCPFPDSTTPVVVLMRHVNEQIPRAAVGQPERRPALLGLDRPAARQGPGEAHPERPPAWYELEEIAVAALGPLWRREARLLVSGTDRAAGPLTPAPFDRATPPAQEASAGYETYLGDSPAAAPPPPPPPPPPAQPPATLEGQPLQPVPAAAWGQATVAPAAAAAAGTAGAGETFQWPAAGGGRSRMLIVVAIVLIAAIAARAFSGASQAGPGRLRRPRRPRSTTRRRPTRRPCRRWPRYLRSSRRASSRASRRSPVTPGRSTTRSRAGSSTCRGRPPGRSPPARARRDLASGEGALWVSAQTPTGGEVRRFVPGSTAPPSAPIPYPGHPAPARVVVSAGTIGSRRTRACSRSPSRAARRWR